MNSIKEQIELLVEADRSDDLGEWEWAVCQRLTAANNRSDCLDRIYHTVVRQRKVDVMASIHDQPHLYITWVSRRGMSKVWWVWSDEEGWLKKNRNSRTRCTICPPWIRQALEQISREVVEEVLKPPRGDQHED